MLMEEKANKKMETPEIVTPPVPRRGFFQWVIRAAMGIIGTGLAVPLVGYVISPAFKRRESSWVDVGSQDEVPVGEPAQLDYVATIHDGYVETKSQTARRRGDRIFPHVYASGMRLYLGQGRQAIQMSLPWQRVRSVGSGIGRS